MIHNLKEVRKRSCNVQYQDLSWRLGDERFPANYRHPSHRQIQKVAGGFANGIEEKYFNYRTGYCFVVRKAHSLHVQAQAHTTESML